MTIEERRKAMIDSKLKEMADDGVTKRTPENSPFFDQPLQSEIERSEEDRKAFMAAKLKEMSESGLMKETPEALRAFTPDDDLEEILQDHKELPPPNKRETTDKKAHASSRTTVRVQQERLAEFRERFLSPKQIGNRKAVYVSGECWKRLDYVVRRSGESGATISAYVERVLSEHLDGYAEERGVWRKL